PQRYTATPQLPGILPHQLRCLLLAVVVVVIHVVVIVAFLLLGLHITETHTETVRRHQGGHHGASSSADGLGKGLGGGREGTTVPTALQIGLGRGWLLVGYRSWQHQVCYVTRLDRASIPGLDSVTDTFRRRQAELEGAGGSAMPLADRSILGTTMNILCSTVPVYWA
ncbi:PSPC protein, partial [Eubucco bourcierii]|nr:PSPC protein [Eubucco bourcierii]